MSQSIWQEIQKLLARLKFERYITSIERDLFLIWLIKSVRFIDITKTIIACRDPKDDKVLELAINGNEKSIITGDRDLLALDPFEGISIVTVRQFLEIE